MNIQTTGVMCNGINQVIVNMVQSENTPIVMNFPYDITGYAFEGTIDFPPTTEVDLSTCITVGNIINCVGSIAGNVLTVASISDGTIAVGSMVAGVNVLPQTFVTALGTGTGGAGTYTVSQQQTVPSTALYSSVASLQLTPEQTQSIPEGQYPFDLWTIGIESTPIQTPVMTGFFAINDTITVVT
jgi:hypothetical protein